MLILASASPRRHALLCAAGIDHVVRTASVAEQRHPGESPTAFVQRIAEAKARAVVCSPTDLVLGADTVVCPGDDKEELFGKPTDDEDASRMLRRLSGRDHYVHTGICLVSGTGTILDVSTTRVSFIQLSESEIREYTRSGEPRDKAGAYGIQGLASKFISSIEGCYHNVVGLPVSLVYRYLKAL
ncbi:MAG: septum formation protein Maf [Acidobacteriaceae bacterium]|nr:septum formation protein Maf [Acidobacteriaceae bacterium]MBV9781641.1 septum formation protein Maf [Acidobacteriaceae bacterium]